MFLYDFLLIKIFGLFWQILEKSNAMIKKNQSSAVEKAITYYHTCMDEDTVEKQGVDPIIKVCMKLQEKGFNPGMNIGGYTEYL